MALLHWVYENTENAGKAVQRVKDLTEIAGTENIQGFRIERIRLKGTRAGYNINVTTDDNRFNTYEEAQSYLRTRCIEMRKARRELAAEKVSKEI